MKNLITLIILCFITNIYAQKDTLYFDSNWVKSTKIDASFYRLIPLNQVGGLYEVKDYYLNGTLQMEGFYSDIENKAFQGEIKWYYKNGQLNEIKHYKKGMLDGEALYYSKKGFLRAKGIYKNNAYWSGTFLDNCCYVGYILEYKDGKKTGKLRYHSDSNQMAVKVSIENDSTTIINHINRKGENIGSMTYINHYPIEGIQVTYFTNLEDDISGIEQYYTYINEKMNGEEAIFTKEGKQLSKGINKDDNPFSGTFYRYNIVKTYVNGKLEGIEIAYSSKKKQIAIGVNKNDEPWEGQFLELYSNNIVSYKNGKLDGKQTYYFSDEYKKVKSYYFISNDRKEGESANYTKDGKELAKGVYKDNMEWEGTFLSRDKSMLSSYKEGEKHGVFIFYNHEGREIKRQEYNEGALHGMVTSSGFFVDKVCECEYKNDEPFTGEDCKEYSVILYKNGKVIKNSTYLSDDQEELKSINYYENEELVKQSNFVDNKEYTIIFKDYRRYSGQEYSHYTGSITSYKNGMEHGPFYNKDTYSGFAISGDKKEGNLDGKITFENFNTGETTTCTYKQGLPLNGTIIKDNKITTYKKGVKHGLETSFSASGSYEQPFDSISVNHKNGKLEGEVHYYLSNIFLAKGIYKNNKPNTGIFYDYSEDTNHSISEYKNGLLQKQEYFTTDFRHLKTYKNGEISNGTFYAKKHVIAEGTYLNEKPYNGNFVEIQKVEAHYYPEKFTLSNYNNGNKNGIEKIYNFKNKVIEQINNYQDGRLNRKTNYITFKHKDSLVGIYKEGKPFSGDFLNELENNETNEITFDILSHFENGEKSSYQYYATKGSRLEVLLDSIKYVAGKPFEGNQLEDYNGSTNKHVFENGKKTKTEIYIFDLKSIPNHTITYTANGFIAYKNYENENVKTSQITYTDTSKKEGTAVYYLKNEEIGAFSFTENGISKANFLYTERNTKVEIESDTLNIIKINIETETELITMEGFLNTPFENELNNFTNWQSIFFGTDGVATFYLGDKKTPISVCVFKQGDEYDGISTRLNKNGTYTCKVFKDGKRVEKKKDLTEKQIIEFVKQKK